MLRVHYKTIEGGQLIIKHKEYTGMSHLEMLEKHRTIRQNGLRDDNTSDDSYEMWIPPWGIKMVERIEYSR